MSRDCDTDIKIRVEHQVMDGPIAIGKFVCSPELWDKCTADWERLVSVPSPGTSAWSRISRATRRIQVDSFYENKRKEYGMATDAGINEVFCKWLEVNCGLVNVLKQESKDMHQHTIVMNDAGTLPIAFFHVEKDRWARLVEEWNSMVLIPDQKPHGDSLDRAYHTLRKAEVAVKVARMRHDWSMPDNCDSNALLAKWVEKVHGLRPHELFIQL